MVDVLKSGMSRIFLIEDRASPAHVPEYQSLGKAGAPDWPQGDLTLVRGPSAESYNQSEIIDEIVAGPRANQAVIGAPGVTLPLRQDCGLSMVVPPKTDAAL